MVIKTEHEMHRRSFSNSWVRNSCAYIKFLQFSVVNGSKHKQILQRFHHKFIRTNSAKATPFFSSFWLIDKWQQGIFNFKGNTFLPHTYCGTLTFHSLVCFEHPRKFYKTFIKPQPTNSSYNIEYSLSQQIFLALNFFCFADWMAFTPRRQKHEIKQNNIGQH